MTAMVVVVVVVEGRRVFTSVAGGHLCGTFVGLRSSVLRPRWYAPLRCYKATARHGQSDTSIIRRSQYAITNQHLLSRVQTLTHRRATKCGIQETSQAHLTRTVIGGATRHHQRSRAITTELQDGQKILSQKFMHAMAMQGNTTLAAIHIQYFEVGKCHCKYLPLGPRCHR